MSGYLIPPPPGVEPDWSRQGWAAPIRDLCIVMLVLTTLLLVARVYTRSVVLKGFGVDDCFCICGWAMITAQTGLVFNALKYGFGRHSYDVEKSKASGLYISYFVLGLLPGVAYFFIKMTFLLTYARIFTPVTYMRWLIWGGVAVVSAFYLGDFLYDLFQCQPISKAWDPSLPGHCAKESVAGGPTGIFNVISDFYILFLPLPMVWSLNMKWKRMLRLLVIFGLGIFTCAMSVTKLAITIIATKNKDKTYVVGSIFFWGVLEWSIGLMVACMIVVPALGDHVGAKLSSSWSRLSTLKSSQKSSAPDSAGTYNGVREMQNVSKSITVSQDSDSV